MNTAARNLAWADAFIAALAAAGLRHVVLAPGARSAPLALAALRRPELVCHVINDERAAGYFALGIGRADGQPAAVLCTSGTAAANLLPAVMEANLADVPLLVLTADRPPEALDWGANQTVDQARLYGAQVRACHALPVPTDEVAPGYLRALAARLLDECRAPLPGPVHANLPFREPLLPETIPAPPKLPPRIAVSAPAASAPADSDWLAERLTGRRGVIVCGEDAYPPRFAAALAALAAALDAPILAEPLANLRFGPHDRTRMLAHQARFLRGERAPPAPDWVLRFGRFPVARSVERWLARCTTSARFLVAAPGRWPDPLWASDALLHSDPLALVEALRPRVRPAARAGCVAWLQAEQAAAAEATALCATDPLFEGAVARALCAALPAGTRLFVGNSLAIRAVDAFSGTADNTLTLHGNRGASGIDGNLATAAGIAAATGQPLAVLLGDQAALHDGGSLALLAGRAAVVVVMDNGGGGIFDHLPFAGSVPAELFEHGWTAPPQADFAALAAAHGLRHATVATLAALRDALRTACASGDAWLLRVVIDRAASWAKFAASQPLPAHGA